FLTSDIGTCTHAMSGHPLFICRWPGRRSGNIRSRSARVWSTPHMPPTAQRPSVAVIGLGYIGLPTAAVLASSGAEVVGVDVNADAVTTINAGQVPFVEPDMATTVAGVVSQGYLRATTETPHAENYIVAVPTPFMDGHEPDLSFIETAGKQIAPLLEGNELIILESTSPPGATEFLADTVIRE